MSVRENLYELALITSLLMPSALTLHAQDQPSPQEKSSASTAEVHVVITDMALRGDSELPRLKQDDVKVKQGKTFLQVTQLIPAQGDNAALQLMILIDDTLDPVIGGNLNELKQFIKAQPSTTVVAIGYMSNATVNIVQNFTADHDQAVNAIRLPRGVLSTMDSPYLSLISVVKGWPQQKVRREVLMFSDGIDRLRDARPSTSQLGPAFGPVYHTMPQISVDASSASEISQRYNVIVSSMYAAGVGRRGRSSWDIELGLGGLSKIAEETGGECYSLGITNLVSFKPYLERFQKALDNQYYLVFLATPKKKAGLQRITIQTEVPNSEIAAPDNVWVPAGQ
jgi:hypothetical protein